MRPMPIIAAVALLVSTSGAALAANPSRIAETAAFLLGNAYRCGVADDRVVRAGKVIRELIVAHPEASRRRLSELLCEAWSWRQPNGALSSMVCRGLMLQLHRAGHIDLPAVRRQNPNPLAAGRRRPCQPVAVCRVSVARGGARPGALPRRRGAGPLADVPPLSSEQRPRSPPRLPRRPPGRPDRPGRGLPSPVPPPPFFCPGTSGSVDP